MRHVKLPLVAVGIAIGAGGASADTIVPVSYSNPDLAVGDSVSVQKTVTVSAGSPTGALLDVMFLFDTTGSMGPFIAGAKAAATDILSGLSDFGDLASGTGFYNDPQFDGVVSDLTTNDSTTVASIGTFEAGVPGFGGDFAELGNSAISEAATDASFRPASNRFIVALGDAPFKDNPDDAAVVADLAAANVELIGVNFGGTEFEESILDLGGNVFAASEGADTITSAILDGVAEGFAEYGEVTVGDLGGGAPEIEIAVSCVSADIGTCSGSTATGDFDRSVDRDFVFDVLFTRTAEGDKSFETYALVDGGIVATESDVFGGEAPEPGDGGGMEPGDGDGTPVIPLPASAFLLLAGMGGLGALRLTRRV